MKRLGILGLVFLLCIIAGLKAEEIICIDNNYADWQGIPVSVSFSTEFNPVYFSHEMDSKSSNLEIESSLYWQKGGTAIKEVKTFLTDTTLYLYIKSHNNFLQNLSVFLYLYSNRNSEAENSFTVEIIPEVGESKGGILLWEKGKSSPLEIGQLKNTGSALELSIPLGVFPKSLLASLDNLSFDLSTCYFDMALGVYEEFFFTFIYFKDMIRSEDL